MEIVEILHTVLKGNPQELERMARSVLTNGRSHAFMIELSQHADVFKNILSRINPADSDYLSLVFILAEHLTDIKGGACPCSIIKKPMYNSPERLSGILEILSEAFVAKTYTVTTHSKCLACGKEYLSATVESGLGQKVIWSDYKPAAK